MVCIALIVAAVISLVNAFAVRRFRLLVIALSLPLVVYVIGVLLVPSYVQSFIVKPNELDRETPFITHNIEWTRKGFGLDQIELRDFPAEPTVQALDYANNRESFEKHPALGLESSARHSQADTSNSHLLRLSRCRC